MTSLSVSENIRIIEENIKKLTDRQATKKEIVSQIKWLVEGAQPGDQLLFHYSGHGAQAPTLFPKLETDGLDEITCPYDFDGSNATTLRDKEFAQLFAGIPKGVHFVWISDSCHAEDLSRDLQMPSEPQYRYFNGLKQMNELNEESAFEAYNASTIITAPHIITILLAISNYKTKNPPIGGFNSIFFKLLSNLRLFETKRL
jgi:hypothetical protein